MTFYAHQKQSLVAHLKGVAEYAARFASFFDAAEQGRLAGLLHDLGKAEDEFQKRILGRSGKEEPHAHHGAALLLQEDAKRGGPVWPVAFAINGHHAGLHDRSNLQKRKGWRRRALAAEKRLLADPAWNGIPWPVYFGKNLPDWLERLPFSTPEERVVKFHAIDLYTRFLFSALIDADRLDTEAHDPETSDNFKRRDAWRFGEDGLAAEEAPEKLLVLLEEAIQKRRDDAQSKRTSVDVLEVRKKVLDACKMAALKQRGVFTLTVPTGGGKTLASVCFALRHIAAQNWTQPDPYRKLRRIIIVIPYLNIIQQTAEALKDAFKHGNENPVVLEHHSQIQDPPTPPDRQDGKRDSDGYSHERTLRQLAAENWDAPIVVTTSVQFFDSLFSRRPADARKLHNIAQSVIIFDEVQTFPPRLMQPILDTLGELTSPERPYGCSLVLCTATQPALVESEDLPCGFKHMERIIEQPEHLFRCLQRTSYPELENQDGIPHLTWPELASKILEAPDNQGLVVVNTRHHARTLFKELREFDQCKYTDAIFHLSTWMTPAHRAEVLKEVIRRLDAKEPCFLVSTQCIEAGVDVDFPAVWRALGPYDSIVQAAGRCNRNGRIKKPEAAQVHVFRPEDEELPSGVYKTATTQTELLRKMGKADPHDPESFEIYFRLLYQLTVPDECEIQRERQELHFEQVSSLFHLIDTLTMPLIIPRWLNTESHCEQDNFIHTGKGERSLAEWAEAARIKGFLLPDEWRGIQPHVLNLDLHDEKQRISLSKWANPVFPKENAAEAMLWILAACSLYEGGLHGSGLNTAANPLSQMLGGL